MTASFFTDAYTDRPTTQRGELEERVRQLKCATWADPGDADLREALAQAEAALPAFDHDGSAA